MDYKHLAIKGATWATILRVAVRLLTFGKIFILARILLPYQFGQFATATILLGLLEICTETGINVFLLQRSEKIDDYIDTAWVIAIIRGTLIALACFSLSNIVASFFNIQTVLPLFYLISLAPFIKGFINPSSIIFQKELNFKNEFGYRFLILLVEAVITIGFAQVTHSVYSFVFGFLVSAIFEVILSFVVITPRPKFIFSQAKARQILNAGKWVTGYGIADYLYSQGDNVVVGKILGQADLGIYQNAYKLAVMPFSEIGEIFYKVTFPLLVKMRQEPKKLRKYILHTSFMFVCLMFGFSLILYFFAPQVVWLLLGPNWATAVPIVQALAFLGAIKGITHAYSPLFMALERQKSMATISAIGSVTLIILVVPAVLQFGIVGAAYAAIAGSLVSLIPAGYYTYKLLHDGL